MNPVYTSEDLLDHHGIGAIITNEHGEILMQEHIKFGFWTIPIGKVDLNKSVTEGLAQELFEECDIIVKNSEEIATKEYQYLRQGKKVVVWGHVFAILKYSGTIKNKEPHKHTKQLFMSIEQIKKLPHLSDMTLLYLESIGIQRPKIIL